MITTTSLRSAGHVTRPRRVRPTATAAANGSSPVCSCPNSSPRRSAAARRRPKHGGVVALRQQHEPAVVAEVHRQQRRVAVEPETLPDQRVEVLGQEVGEVERARLGVVEGGEPFAPGEELVAVGTGESLDARVLGEERVERPAGAAVGVGDEHARARCRRRRSPRAAPARSARDGCAGWPEGSAPRRRRDPARASTARSSVASAPHAIDERALASPHRTDGPGGSAARRARRAVDQLRWPSRRRRRRRGSRRRRRRPCRTPR